MADILRMPLRLFRRATNPQVAPLPPAELPNEPAGAPNVVILADRRPTAWCPPMPWVGMILFGAVLTTATVTAVADFHIAMWRA